MRRKSERSGTEASKLTSPRTVEKAWKGPPEDLGVDGYRNRLERLPDPSLAGRSAIRNWIYHFSSPYVGHAFDYE
jgi:hypothetical protein